MQANKIEWPEHLIDFLAEFSINQKELSCDDGKFVRCRNIDGETVVLGPRILDDTMRYYAFIFDSKGKLIGGKQTTKADIIIVLLGLDSHVLIIYDMMTQSRKYPVITDIELR